MARQTQKEMILQYMKDNGSITPVDALREFGCMRLAPRISDLKDDGVEIETVPEFSKNRYGVKVRYARYVLHGR